MPEYSVCWCPYCRNVWRAKADREPVSCPKCKRRFDTEFSTTKPVKCKRMKFDDYGGLLKFLDAEREKKGSQ